MKSIRREQYQKDLIEALLTLDKDTILAFHQKYNQRNIEDMEDEVFWLSVHKVRAVNLGMPARESQISANWLLEHSSVPGIGLSDKKPIILSTCPFCGGEVDIYHFKLAKSTGISCSHCGALVSFINGAPEFVTAARWNIKRVTPAKELSNATNITACPLCGDAVETSPQAKDAPFMFYCPTCGARVSFRGAEDERRAIAAWNRRMQVSKMS